MRIRKLPITLAVLLAALCFIHGPTQAQPGGDPVVEAAAPVIVDADAVVADGDAVVVDSAKADKEVTVEDLANQAQKIQEDWERLGWMGGTIAIIGFLLLLLRLKPINTLLGEHDLKRFKPLAAAVLGVLLGFLQTFITGKGSAISVVAGVIAGIATPGLHLLFTKGNTK